MLFNSSPFVILLLLTFLVYYRPCLHRLQVHILIISSFIFYGYNQPYLLILLLFSATINAVTAHSIHFSSDHTNGFRWAAAGVISNLLILGTFKYNKLIAASIFGDLSRIDGPGELFITLPLPVGISFYTFQGISLLVDLYRKESDRSPCRFDIDTSFLSHYKKTVFFTSFFPQLVAGPIVKANDFMPQIKQKFFEHIDWNCVFQNIILGYFLKIVIADNLKDQTFWIAYPYFQGQSTLTLLSLLFGYSIQIFADFAGYSLIAIGVGALFGYRLPQNFNFPYLSQSFAEFWQRWHISLSTWLKEYLYIPLGGNRKTTSRTYINLLIVMLLGGLWHGAAWSYAAWGVWHGLALIIERMMGGGLFAQKQSKLLSIIRAGFVFIFVTFAWLFFKLPEFQHVLLYVGALFQNTGIRNNELLILSVFFYSVPVIFYHLQSTPGFQMPVKVFQRLKPVAYGVMLFLILVNGGTPGEFIYFQF